MKMLIFEGPDNLGKSTVIKQMTQVLEKLGHKVHVMVQPNREDWTPVLEQYVMGDSEAIPIERQYQIGMNCIMQYLRVPKDTDIVLSDRHFAVSNLVYFRDGSLAGDSYRRAVQEATLKMHEILGIDYTCCMLLVGDQPFAAPDQAEHFEVSAKWQDICRRYNRLKYTNALLNCGIEACAIDAWNAKDKVLEIAAGLFQYALKHGSLPSPLSRGIQAPADEGEGTDCEVYPVPEGSGEGIETTQQGPI